VRTIPDIESLLREYTAYLCLQRGLSANTAAAYRLDVIKLTSYLTERRIAIRSVDYEVLEAFAVTLYDLGVAETTRKRVVAGVRSFFHFLRIENFIKEDPSLLLESPRPGVHLPEVLTLDEINSLISAIDPETAEAQRNRAIMETLYSCGLRVSELVNLTIAGVNFDESFIRVTGKGSKERLVPMSDMAADCIRAYLEDTRTLLKIERGEEGILFLNRRGHRLTRQMIFTIIRRLADSAGIRKTISPHTLRHSFATHLLEGGANLLCIQQMLGHESVATTEIYIHLDTSRLRSEILQHHPRNRRS
jgi:tyrosine recombinase xerD